MAKEKQGYWYSSSSINGGTHLHIDVCTHHMQALYTLNAHLYPMATWHG